MRAHWLRAVLQLPGDLGLLSHLNGDHIEQLELCLQGLPVPTTFTVICAAASIPAYKLILECALIGGCWRQLAARSAKCPPSRPCSISPPSQSQAT